MKPDTVEQPNPNDCKFNLRPEVREFAEAMERQLQQHDLESGATGWSDISRMVLLLRMEEELREFKEKCLTSIEFSHQPTIRKAADVANFLMMICDRLLDD